MSTSLVKSYPFVKWVGGKRAILPSLIKRRPESYGVYHEVFVGGGALFFELQPERAVLSDVNVRLMTTYEAIRDRVEEVIELLKVHRSRHSRAYYAEMRDVFNGGIEDSAELGALFVYLNKMCFNGLYRENKKGRFNASVGDKSAENVLDESGLRAASFVLRGAELKCCDFVETEICCGDFYYLDPPYHGTFNEYSALRFSDEDHERLARMCHEIDEAGGFFLLSNSDTEFVRELYSRYVIDEVMAPRRLSTSVWSAGHARELLIRNYA